MICFSNPHRYWFPLAILTLGVGSTLCAHAQTSSGLPPVSSQSIQDTQKNQAKKGKVILQRSTDENGVTTDTPPAPAPSQAEKIPPVKVAASSVPETSVQSSALDAERNALTTTGFDFDIRLRPAESHLATRVLLTLRNDGKAPLDHIPLQISSTLEWELMRLNGRSIPFTVGVLNSDIDHTGQVHEAVVTLPTPLAPGASLQLDVTYSGAIAQSARRLQAIGTPDDVASTSDWDRISTGFTGLRGFGNVLWYPVSAVPALLGDGARLFDEIGSHKLRLAGAHFTLALTVETPSGLAPTIALVNGHPAPLAFAAAQDTSVASIATARVDNAILGFEAPSLFVASRISQPATNVTLWTRPESSAAVPAWATAASDVTPFLQSWLGVRPRSQLTILELPEDGDIPFETGAMLATPVRSAAPEVLDGVMAHALTHAWVLSPRAWLSEGVAHFMGTLWIEKQQGRERALATLDSARSALALAEPESPGVSDGQPLVACISPVYYRTKATYVFWMLREMAGDPTLSAALRAYDPSQDTTPGYFEKLIEQAGQRRNLSAFFADWVYADKGLPDLSIESVFPTSASVPGSYLVAVNVANNGYVSVEAPVQVISDTSSVTQSVILAPRSKATQRILIQGKPTEVRLNDGVIPESQATIHSKTLDLSVVPSSRP